MILIYRSHSSQIDRHSSTFLVSDMSIKKLQKVATTHVDASVKARWLRWWNSPADVKAMNKFPTSLPLREKVLEEWLHKASFWAQVFHFTFLKLDEWWGGSISLKSVPGGLVHFWTLSEPRGSLSGGYIGVVSFEFYYCDFSEMLKSDSREGWFMWEPTNTKSSGLAGFYAKSECSRVT
jgi:hypothetical protein